MAHPETAVDGNDRSGDVGGVGRSEERHDPRDFVDRGDALQRHRSGKLRQLLLAEHSRHVGVDETWRNTVDSNATTADFTRQRARHAADAGIQ